MLNATNRQIDDMSKITILKDSKHSTYVIDLLLNSVHRKRSKFRHLTVYTNLSRYLLYKWFIY